MINQPNFDKFMVDRLILSLYDFKITPVFHDQRKQIDDLFCKTLFSIKNSGQLYSKYNLRKHTGLRGGASLKYVPESKTMSLTLNLELNPTKIQRNKYAQASRIAFPKSFDNKENFIPPDLIERIGRYKLHYENVLTIKGAVNNFLNEIITLIHSVLDSQNITISQPKFAIQEVEIYFDQVISNPFEILQNHQKSFSSYFQISRKDEYETYYYSDGLEFNSPCLKASSYKGELHKIYVKSPSVLRFETAYKKERIRSLCETNVIDLSSFQSIISLFYPLAQQTQKVFCQTSQIKNHSLNTDLLFAFFYYLARSCPKEKVFTELSNILLTNGRICSAKDYYYPIHRLKKKGILKMVRRGIYILKPSNAQVRKAFSGLLGFFGASETDENSL